MYSLIQQILSFVYYFSSIYENTQMGIFEDGGVLTYLIQGMSLGQLETVGITSESLGIILLQCALFETIATLVITVLVVWLICKLICRIFDC